MTNTIIAAAMVIILRIETNNGTNVRDGDGGRAVGHYQMHRIAVDEVNRLYGTSYKYSDRRDFVKSTEMCRLTLPVARGVIW